MAALQIDQFTQALFGKVESVLIVCAILILVVGIPLIWLRLKLERGLIRVIRSARERRQAQKSAANTDSSETVPHCPICNALMVKRVARRGSHDAWLLRRTPPTAAAAVSEFFGNFFQARAGLPNPTPPRARVVFFVWDSGICRTVGLPPRQPRT